MTIQRILDRGARLLILVPFSVIALVSCMLDRSSIGVIAEKAEYVRSQGGTVVHEKRSELTTRTVSSKATTEVVVGEAGHIFGTAASEGAYVVQTASAQVIDVQRGATRTPLPFSTPLKEETVDLPTNSLNFRIDSVKILEDEGDITPIGEAFFVVSVVREDESSAKLIIPDRGTLQVEIGQTVKLDKFSLTINDLKKDEQIIIFFIGFDSDTESRNESYIDLGLGLTAEAIEDAITNPASNSLRRYILGHTTGDVLKWWQSADVLGEGYLLLNESDQLIGKTQTVITSNGNLEVTFSVIGQ